MKPEREICKSIFEVLFAIAERLRASLVAQRGKCLLAMRETRIQSLGQEDSLGKEMATHSSTLGKYCSTLPVLLENPMDGEAW